MEPFIDLYCALLCYVLCFPGVLRRPLLLISRRRQTIYDLIQRAVSNGHLLVSSFTPGKGSRARTFQYFIISMAGIEYLQQHYSDCTYNIPEMDWINFLVETSDPKYRPKHINNRQMIKAVRVANASMVMAVCGANMDVGLLPDRLYSSDELNEHNNYNNLIAEAFHIAINSSVRDYNVNPLARDGIHFQSAYKVKDIISTKYLREEKIDQTRYAGIVSAHGKDYTVYYNLGESFSLNHQFLRAEEQDFHNYKSISTGPLGFQELSGIILVESVRSFAAIVNTFRAKTISNKQVAVFSSLVAFAIHYDGITSLKNYLDGKHDQTRSESYKKMRARDGITEAGNTITSAHFPFRYHDLPVYDGLLIKPLEIVYDNYLVTQPHTCEIGIMCQSWQVPYYKAVFPHAIFFVV